MNEMNEPLQEEGSRKLLIKEFIDGIQNFCDSQDITVTVENSAKEHLAHQLNEILIKIAEKTREAASNATMLRPSHIKEALNNMMSDIMLRIARGEGARCLALYGTGLLELEPPLSENYNSGNRVRTSMEDISTKD
ncbi:hypothetical protein TNCT_219801 [Trichonephila clavata]|uniref:Uncharacterized protein n=1 Tax=Trichonephila clavata TaxID=2740835 RepID=A0A8X6F0A6_TRICU|nr:hypothetical protein TNCT_219801 [Trichonephila clavata]